MADVPERIAISAQHARRYSEHAGGPPEQGSGFLTYVTLAHAEAMVAAERERILAHLQEEADAETMMLEEAVEVGDEHGADRARIRADTFDDAIDAIRALARPTEGRE